MSITTSRTYSCGVLTVSDRGARGEREDISGKDLIALLNQHGYRSDQYAIVPDDIASIQSTLSDWADNLKIDLLLTTGGTGVSPTDRTPEATRSVIDREIPGISEIMRAASSVHTINAALSRGISGIRKESLIINLPGSPRGAVENLKTILPLLPHAIEKIKGNTEDCAGP